MPATTALQTLTSSDVLDTARDSTRTPDAAASAMSAVVVSGPLSDESL